MRQDQSTHAVQRMSQLPSVVVSDYSAELRTAGALLGDKASARAFRALLEEERRRVRRFGGDPLGDRPSAELSKKKLDKVLTEGNPEAAGVVQGAIEQFANELADVVARLLKLKTWRGTELIVVGGGLRASRIGELAIGRASVLVKSWGQRIILRPIHHQPDEAGLIGALHLVPAWMLAGHQAILAVDIGGSNIRAGIVTFDSRKKRTLPEGKVYDLQLWRHCDERMRPTRDEAVGRLGKMLDKLVHRALKDGIRLAPFVGVGCPGIIAPDGTIESGSQNLPGNWESNRFNLPTRLREMVPKVDGHEVTVLMHNDAVVQGLSELADVRDVDQWGVLTIGTGLGNALFVNRKSDDST